MDEEQPVRIKADFVISAFGSELTDSDGKTESLFYSIWNACL